MRATPPAELVALLGRLGLATPRQVRAAYRHARRLAKDLALFDSVWVDALVQARVLTPFQAAAINEGRGENLRVGPFILVRPLAKTASGECFEARVIASGRAMRLTVIPVPTVAGEALGQIERLIEKSMSVRSPHLVPIEECGLDNGRLWTASASVVGRTAAAWLVRGGRMPGEVVLEVARQMVATLTICEAAGLLHGDISAQQLALDPLGQVQLLSPGLRPLIETILAGQRSDRAVETVDYLAPERAAAVAPVSVTTEIFACGALWWHLLAGRPPFAGAKYVDRLRAACATRIRDIKPMAPDTPEPLIAAIRCATEPAPERRPQTFAELLQLLGPASDRGQALLARFVARGVSPPERLVRRVRTIRRSPNLPTWATASAGVLLALGIGSWPLWTPDSPAAQPLSVQHAAGVATSKIVPKPVGSNVATAVRRDATPQVVTAVAAARGKPQKATAAQQKSQVVRTSATESVAVPGPAEDRKAVSREFVVSARRPVPWSQVRPAQGQCVRSRPGERAQIILPASGATLATENVCFEDIDFVVSAPTTRSALVITAAGATFTRCSLQVITEAGRLPAAFEWQPAAVADANGLDRLELRECVLANVGAGVRCCAKRPAEIAMTNVLFLGADALAEIDSSHDVPGRVDVRLKHCTVRGAAQVLEWRVTPEPVSALNVEAVDCVFELAATGTVLAVSSSGPVALSPNVLRTVAWRGSGSLVGLKTPLVRWRYEDGKLQPVGDARLRAEGLVRTEMGFAGEIGHGPDASRLVRWQVPLRSTTPPGIGDMTLPRLR